MKVGDNIVPVHGGIGGEKHMPFRITGILERSGTPADRAAFVNIEGFFLIPDHAVGHVEPVLKPGREEKKMLTTPVPEELRNVPPCWCAPPASAAIRRKRSRSIL